MKENFNLTKSGPQKWLKFFIPVRPQGRVVFRGACVNRKCMLRYIDFFTLSFWTVSKEANNKRLF